MNLSERLRSETEHLSPADGSRIAARLRAEAVRRATLARCPTPIDLARYCDPSLRTSPAVEAISRAMRWALTTRRARLIISMPPQEGKLGSMDTVIPTTTGETTYRDVRVGDMVFHPSGKPIAVTEVHPPGSADRRVHFSDHSHLDVHAAHEWTVYDRSARKWRTVETRYLESQRLRSGPEGRGGRYRFQLPWHETLDLPEVDLPIDPYTLGLWLGNGAESGSVISRDPRNEYRYAYPVSSSHTHKDTGVIYDYLGGGLRVLLRTHHLLGNKHIPRRYLRASEQQRRALLAGLIDTDGHIPEKGQQISFDNTNRQMVFDVAELLRTLGYRAHVHKPIPASVGGEVAGRPIAGRKEFWRVTYSPHDGHVPTRLDRHRRITAKAQRRRVAVTRVEHIDPVPGRCITVDSPDGLYLAGSHFTPTHNSMGVGVWGTLWAHMRDPNTAVTLGSYSLDLARQHSRTARNLVQVYGSNARDPLTGEPLPDRLGFAVAEDKAAANHWGIQGHGGGMYVAGRGGTMTGFPSHVMIIDDPVSGLEEATSKAVQREVWEWWTGTVIPRLSSTAPVILIATRWDEHDLLGTLIGQDVKRARKGLEPRWRVVNIPALSGGGIPDTLGRPPGVYLDSVRDRTPADWEDIRESVGPRAWSAIYLGDPKPAGSTVFDQTWFDRSRVSAQPAAWRMRVVSVDPAETGQGDEAGVIALGATLTADNTVGPILVTHDRSGHMQSDAWSRAAVLLALQIRADHLIYEAFVREFTYRDTIIGAWHRVREQCSALASAAAADPTGAADVERLVDAAIDGIVAAGRGHSFARLSLDDEGVVVAGEDVLAAELREVHRMLSPATAPDGWRIGQIATMHRPPYRLTGHRAKGSKRVRATGAEQAAEVGRLRMLGWHEKLETQLAGWSETDPKSPDRMDALSNGYNEMRNVLGRSVSIAAPAAGHTPTAKPEQGIAAVSDPRTRSSAPSRGPRRPMRRTAI